MQAVTERLAQPAPDAADRPAPGGTRRAPGPRPAPPAPGRGGRRAALGVLALALLVGAAAAVALVRLAAGPHYPLSDDAAGHLYKALALRDALRSGGGIPALFPGWYAGTEAFRYYPIVPYLLLLPALAVAGVDHGAAVQLVLVAGLAASAVGVLLWRRALGWPVALLGIALAFVLPDPLRVAFVEGNVPRVVAQALLLPTVWAGVECARGRRWPALLLVLLLPLTVLAHAMIAATAAVAVVLVVAAGVVAGRWPARAAARVIALAGAGLALAGWWLIPSLSGGLGAIDPEAVRDALLHFAPWQAFDPVAPRTVPYLGLALIGGALVAVLVRGRASAGWPYLVAGVPLVLACVDPFASVYLRLPVANLLWPIRLASAGQALLLLGLLHVAAEELAGRGRRVWPAAALLVLLAADGLPTLAVVRAGTPPPDQVAVAAQLAAAPGWREATLDLSRLGSSPTLLWAGREQLYGWGYQGARNAAEVADLNDALEHGRTGYLLDRLDWWGVDDVVLDRPRPEVEAALAAHGFVLRGVSGALRHWGRAGAPRAVFLDHPVLGIGEGTRVWAGDFPRIVRGRSDFVDDYTLDELRAFDRIVLSRAQWHSRAAAEALIRQYAAGGGQVIADLTGSPDDPLTRAPRFLGVDAERLPFPAAGVTVAAGGADHTLAPFDIAPWSALTYVGLDRIVATTAYSGETADIIGTLDAGRGAITFVGLNLAYHLALTGDPVAADLLAGATGLAPGRGVVAGAAPLAGYRADGQGYHFAITLDRDRQVVVPVARHDGLTVTVDGRPWVAGTLDDSLVLNLPAGRHEVAITVRPGGNRALGFAVSGAGLALALALLRCRRRAGRRPPTAPRQDTDAAPGAGR
ncbi:MAG TPA: 6-pyruvoyl-tetrahydropterin synthase-related protein [Thermomicrobiales bacterium]|nr:6-pyruvoyl-tetrahydropterin synthase-related protein [Thermomicrobiales bacterium]